MVDSERQAIALPATDILLLAILFENLQILTTHQFSR